jgi:hypothetical protein
VNYRIKKNNGEVWLIVTNQALTYSQAYRYATEEEAKAKIQEEKERRAKGLEEVKTLKDYFSLS